MKFFLYLIMATVVVELVSAVDTLSFENCPNLKLSCPNDNKYSTSQQKELVLSMLTTKYPDHGLIDRWDSAVKIEEAPSDAVRGDQETITGAWMKATTVMPSVKYGEKYFTDKNAKVRADYGYSLGRPQNFDAGLSNCGGEGSKDVLGNCKTLYSSNADKSTLQIYQDGTLRQTFANLEPPNFRIANIYNITESNAEAVLNIVNVIRYDAYVWQSTTECCNKKCVKTQSGEKCTCLAYRFKCVKVGSGERTDTLSLRDSLHLSMSSPEKYPIKRLVFDDTQSLYKGYLELNKNGLQSYSIDFGKAKIQNNFMRYNITYKYEPYNILEMETYQQITSDYETAFISKVKDMGDFYRVYFSIPKNLISKCEITYKNFFGSNTTKCTYTFMNKTTLSLKADKVYYSEDDRIQVSISLMSKNEAFGGDVNLTYGNQNQIVKIIGGQGNASLVANRDYGIIRAHYETDLERSSADQSVDIVVSRKAPIALLTTVIVSLGLLYFIYKQWIGKRIEEL